MIGHKASLNKLKKIEIISSIFSDHKDLKLQTNLREKKIKNTQINGDWIACYQTINRVDNEIKEKIKNFLEIKENEHTIVQNLWSTAKAVLSRKFIAVQANLKKIETFQINNLTLHLQELKEQQQRQSRASRRKEITKIRAELNDIETKRTIQRINKSRSWFFER